MRAIIFLGGAAMAASFVLTWIEPPFAGPHVSPLSMLSDGMIRLGADAAWQAWAFVGGFGLAALAALIALRGRGAALPAIVAGAIPFVLIGDAIIRAEDLRRDLGLPFPVDFSDIAATWDVMQDFIRPGVWAYAGGAVALLVAGLGALTARR